MRVRDELRHPDIVPLGSPEGKRRLRRAASHLGAFRGFRKQRHSRACAAVSAGLVLHNVADAPLDESTDWSIYRLDGVARAKPREETEAAGMTLAAVTRVVESQGVRCAAVHAAEAPRGA
eukprot:gene6732-723_t